MRTSKNVLSKIEHRTGAAGHRQGAGRVPNDALLRQKGPRWMSAAPGRDPCSLLKGALRLQILNIYRASSGLRWICDHERRRNEIRKGPARSRNSTASRWVWNSYGARWICESPFTSRLCRSSIRACAACPFAPVPLVHSWLRRSWNMTRLIENCFRRPFSKWVCSYAIFPEQSKP